ncbi:Retrotransposon gag protein [Gossypium australe]|uniref:Retrotransposon gag protein n=1 Tax=Gossypium australe TaxID=47621 RepID=A0A5B6WVS4_9ROSI|nr:Retrotransposon gag protein [Gossypium australe]
MIQNNLLIRGIMTEDPNQHSPKSITTWNELLEKFLYKFFPISKMVQLRREIATFKQLEKEIFHEVWELDAQTRTGLDGSVGGALMNRTYEDVYNLIENVAMNSCQ